MSIIRAMWEESEPYMIGNVEARRVFETPSKAWFDPESAQFNTTAGTSDLAWCKRVMDEGFFEKAGWPEYQGREFPFLVDTNIHCMHINNTLSGEQYPPGGIHDYWRAVRESRGQVEAAPPPLGVAVSDGIGVGEKVG